MIANPFPRPGRTAAHLIPSLIFSALILATALGGRVLEAHGWASAAEIGKRLSMAIVGGYFMFTGNAMPKALAGVRCDPVAAQIFLRFAGWTWALTGLALAATWLLFPLSLAATLTLCIVPVAMALILYRRLTLPRRPQPLA